MRRATMGDVIGAGSILLIVLILEVLHFLW